MKIKKLPIPARLDPRYLEKKREAVEQKDPQGTEPYSLSAPEPQAEPSGPLSRPSPMQAQEASPGPGYYSIPTIAGGAWLDGPPLSPPPSSQPNWYPDPTGRHEWRYFDGSRWTEHVADGGQAGVDQL